MDTTCLYAHLLGDHFESLPSPLREFHRCGGCATGTFTVERTDTGITAAIVNMFGLPKAAHTVDVRLEVHQTATEERWSRWFGPPHRLMRTRQWARSGLLIEQAGLMRFGFHIKPAERGFTFETVQSWCLGVRTPRSLAPQVHASVIGDNDGWVVDVQIHNPRGTGGLVCRYGGRMQPT